MATRLKHPNSPILAPTVAESRAHFRYRSVARFLPYPKWSTNAAYSLSLAGRKKQKKISEKNTRAQAGKSQLKVRLIAVSATTAAELIPKYFGYNG